MKDENKIKLEILKAKIEVIKSEIEGAKAENYHRKMNDESLAYGEGFFSMCSSDLDEIIDEMRELLNED